MNTIMIIEASFEDFIYVIIGIGWLLYSVYNAKKKKEKSQKVSSEKKSPSFIDALMNEFGNNDIQPEVKTNNSQDEINYFDNEVEQQPDPISAPEKIFSYDDEYEQGNYNTIADVVENEQIIVKNDDVIIDKPVVISTYKIRKKRQNKVDLRKAIIYSEIMKKKYF